MLQLGEVGLPPILVLQNSSSSSSYLKYSLLVIFFSFLYFLMWRETLPGWALPEKSSLLNRNNWFQMQLCVCVWIIDSWILSWLHWVLSGWGTERRGNKWLTVSHIFSMSYSCSWSEGGLKKKTRQNLPLAHTLFTWWFTFGKKS